MKTMQPPAQARGTRRRIAGRAQRDHIPDPYQTRQKPNEPTVCPSCGVVYRDGRWQRGERPSAAHAETCPACRRIADGFPAGILTLHGDFADSRRDEIMGLVRNVEEAEKGEHPLNRIVGVEDSEDGVVISTTDIHLPRRLGEALRRAFHGELDMHFDENAYFARIDWHPPP